MKLLILLSLVFVSINSVASNDVNTLSKKTIRFCGGTHEWPPYYNFKRNDGKKTNEITGYDIDLFNEVFTKNGIDISVKLIPWKRCLAEGKEGKQYDVVFGGGLNDDRRKNYVTTDGYYAVTPSYFYPNKSFKDGIKVSTPKELSKYKKLCGIAGFNYVNFGQDNKLINMSAKDYQSLVKKTAKSRCDVSFVRLEILKGWGDLLGMDFINNPEITISPIPNIKKETFHLMISKNNPHAEKIKTFFEKKVEELKNNGQYELIYKD